MASEYRLIYKDAKIDEKYIRHYVHKYQVIVDEFNPSAAAVCAIVPGAIFDPHPVDPYAYMRSKTGTPISGQLGFWEVVEEYDSTPQDPSQQQTSDNNQNTTPEVRPPVITCDTEATTRPLIKDLAGNPVVNSVGMLYDPPLTTQVYYPLINISWFSLSFDIDDIQRYTNKANSEPYTIAGVEWPARNLLCTKYTAESQYEQGGFIWHKAVQLKVAGEDSDGVIEWDKIKGLDAGTHHKVAGKPPQPILDRTGNPVTSPVPLDGNGQPLLSGQPPVYREHRAFQEVSFVSLIS